MSDDIAAGSSEDDGDGSGHPYSLDNDPVYAETVEIRRRLAGVEPVDDPDDPTAAAAVERLGQARSGEWRAGEMSEWLREAPSPGPDSSELRGWLSTGQRKFGLRVLLIEPGGKRPAAMHPRGVHDATDCPVVLAGYLDEYAKVYPGQPVNVAVALGPSRLAVFDADLPGELSPLLDRLGVDTPTVRSPGSSPSRTRPDADGVAEWVRSHHGGGHVWLVVPEGVEVPRVRRRKGEQADLRHGDAYVLMPPSIRPPGPYEAVGVVGVLDDAVLGRIADMIDPGPARGDGSGTGARSGRRDRASQPGDRRFAAPGDTLRRSVAAWEDATPWGDLLAPHGWDWLERPDSCGCTVWTAPGTHASDRSATAHDNPDRSTCGVRLHVWTDDPGLELAAMLKTVRSESLSKLHVYAAYRTGGDVGAAIAELQLDAEGEGQAYDAGGPVPPLVESDASDDRPLNLPSEFWRARPVLSHIHAAAHRAALSPDAVLGAVLARLSARLDPAVTVETGIRSGVPLHLFVALVGPSGSGKTAAARFAEALLPDPDPVVVVDPDPESGADAPMLADPSVGLDGEPVMDTRVAEYGLGTGQGIAEAYMGSRAPASGKGRAVRTQVRTNVLLVCDEGASMLGMLDQSGSILASELRAAWAGALRGQANGRADTTRRVERYALGLIVGFQPAPFARLLSPIHIDLGTPQRFCALWAADESIPDVPPPDPGPLVVGELPTGPLILVSELQDEVRAHARSVQRGTVEVPPLESQRTSMVVRLAALLAILSGRTQLVDRSDWMLAERVYETSLGVQSVAARAGEEQEHEEADRRAELRRADVVSQALAVDERVDAANRMSQRIVAQLRDAGGSVVWRGRDGIRMRVKGADRRMADTVVRRLCETGQLIEDGLTLRLAGPVE